MVFIIGCFYEEINMFCFLVMLIVMVDVCMFVIFFLSIENVMCVCGDRVCVYLFLVICCEMKILYRDFECGIIWMEMGYLFVLRGKG